MAEAGVAQNSAAVSSGRGVAGHALRTPLARRQPASTAVLAGFVLAALAPAAAGDERTRPAIPAETRAAAEQITLELIMSDPDWIGNSPTDPYWADDSGAVYFEQKRVGSEARDLFRIDLETGEQTRVEDRERGSVDVREGRLSLDFRRKTYERHGDIYVKDLAGGKITQLTRTAALETDPRFMADGRRVVFRRGDEILVRDLEAALEYQPVDFRLEEDPAAATDGDDFLSAQQLRLFDVLRREKENREAEEERERREQATDPTRPPLPVYLGAELEIIQAALSPAGQAVLLVVSATANDPGRKDRMADWVTESGYVVAHEVRPKVGTRSGPGERLIYIDLENHERHDLDLAALPGIADDPLAELKRRSQTEQGRAGSEESASDGIEGTAPLAGAADAGDENRAAPADAAGEPPLRPVTFDEDVAWSPDGGQLAVQAHSIDNKDRWIALVDLEDKALKPIHRLSDEAWINWYFNEFGWLPDSRRLYFLSEESGYSQLYLYSLDDGTTRRLTSGESVVSDVVLAPDARHFYYTANPDHPGVYETYRVAIDSGRSEQLTRLGGKSSSVLSPDGESLLITHSTLTRPPELYVQAARPGAVARRITRSVSERFLALPWVTPEIVTVPSTHQSRPIYSRFYAPSQPRNDGEGRPAVVFVHGAGYLQNAHQGWSRYFREFMFHTYLTRRGYLVLDMDYRASAGYGVEWRTAIYRQMGAPELEDLEDGVAWLVAEHGVDPERVGVYGGSYGGFMTMMALFKRPDLFACGAALRPVTDWAHYNHSYTSNILNTPEVDPQAYRRSSPIELAEGLAKPLLICAPMQDDNVFFQDTVRLAQRLIELEKEDWEVAIFPVEPHGFRQPSSWLDEYRRIFKLFETHLKP